ncbi:MAG: hypothetical protein GKR88_11410 [Flavobacteriaceae bacterium]|nr:MAG: hypothetical protein GKR88_11410 [Flavobacteriaceae bacterium]
MKTKVFILTLVSVLLNSCSNEDSISSNSNVEIETIIEQNNLDQKVVNRTTEFKKYYALIEKMKQKKSDKN